MYMLKINKILLKKIKFPLSLRGLFPFCHSRESGNPSSLSLRGGKQASPCESRGSNLSGFSLIELMVAAAILAFVLFGIFQAYSTGFMGMADAKDRTVATNYAREAMEDIKNMEFELITNENLSTPEIIDEKFNRVVTVLDEYVNLKKITTRVFWTNRKGQIIDIDTTMHINKTQFLPEAAAKIILYANPYYTVLPSFGIVELIAIIKDEKGNTKIDWDDGDIYFTVLGTGYSDFPKNDVGSYLGDIEGRDEIPITPTKGVAKTTFTASELTDGEGNMEQGDVIIKAWVVSPDMTSNPITITVTLDVVRIDLSADPTIIEADGTSISIIEAALKNSGDETVLAATNDVTFNISGEGTFVNLEGASLPNTTTILPTSGIAIIYVKSINDTPGTAIVTASSEGLLSDAVSIITTGQPANIFVLINPDSIYMNETAEVIVTIKDINGVAVDFTGSINLNVVIETSTGDGTFDEDFITFDGTTSTETAIFTPISTGNTTIRASDAAVTDKLNEGTADITISETLVASKITVSAIPQNIEAGGIETSSITAKVRTEDNIIVSSYVESITFETTLGYFSNNMSTITLTINDPESDYENYENGIANVELFPSDDIGEATITVSSGSLTSGSVDVGFYSNAHHINLSAVPQKMLVGGETCTITATIVDVSDNIVENYNEEITFTILEGWPSSARFTLSNTSVLIQTVNSGVSDVWLTSQNKAGTVEMRATSFTGATTIDGYLNIPVGITLDLELGSVSQGTEDGKYFVSFDVNIQGADLILEEMQVSWEDILDTLNEININGIGVYSNSASNGTVVDVTDTNLSIGISNIKMYFNPEAVMSGETINVVFNPNSGSYSVVVPVPSL